MSAVASFTPSLPSADSPIRTIALQRLKLNVPVFVAVYVCLHSDLYTYIVKKKIWVPGLQWILERWYGEHNHRIGSAMSEVACRQRASELHDWAVDGIYALLVWNILQALYALYTNSTTAQMLQPASQENAAPAPLAAPAPGPNSSTRVRASLTRSLPDSPMSHPAFPVTMSSDSLRRRLTQQSEGKRNDETEKQQITSSGDLNKGQTSQPDSSRQPEQPSPSRLPLSRLLQKQSQLSASQTLGLLAPSPALSQSYLSRSIADSFTSTGFSLPTPGHPEDEDLGSLRASSSRRYDGSFNKDLGGVSVDALQSFRARHSEGGTLRRSTAGSAVDRVRALNGLKMDGDEDSAPNDGHDGLARQMVAA